MPKMKSHTGIGKKVRVTARGKIMAQQSGLRHNLENKSSRVTRRLTGRIELAKADSKRIRKMLGR